MAQQSVMQQFGGADLEADRTRGHNQAADRATSGGDGEAAQEGDCGEGSGSEAVLGATYDGGEKRVLSSQQMKAVTAQVADQTAE